MNPDPHTTARRLLLGSASARFTAVARGSAASTPFCLAPDGTPLLEATAGAAVSIALGAAGDTFALVLRGRAIPLAAAEDASLARWRRHHPAHARPPVRLAEPHALLCAAGGQHALDYFALVRDALFDWASETRMVEHMNDDHLDALRDYCAHAGVSCTRVAPLMAGVDVDGFFVLADEGAARFDFPAPCPSPLAVRKALVALAQAARAAERADGD
ncbi:MAG: DUF2470 domain-containing protein [Gammaproteobacteria bacterium]